MTRRTNGSPRRTRARIEARRRAANVWAPRSGATAGRPILSAHDSSATTSAAGSEITPVQAMAVEAWERHGAAAYALACALLGDEQAASRAVTRAMADFVLTPVSPDEARRTLARHVYRRCEELAENTPRTLRLPPAMVWIGQLAQAQRTCLALCLYGGHTHREAAALVGLSPVTVAGLLSSGLRELGHIAAR